MSIAMEARMPTLPASLAGGSAASASMSIPAPRWVFSITRNEKRPKVPLPDAATFIGGAMAGAASRTVVSPLERLKIILQVQGSQGEYRGTIQSLAKMWREEGFRGYMRGNGINVLRIAPYSAVQFSSYELLKGAMIAGGYEIDTPQRLIAGSLAGIASVMSTYPLDLVRSRLSIESAKLGHATLEPEGGRKSSSIIGMTMKVFREEGGFRGLYRGLTPTAVGVAPYVAGNFAFYELLKQMTTTETFEPGTFTKLICGGVAGMISQTATFPLDVLRRRMQVTGVASLGYAYNSSWDAIRTIVRQDGLKGLYKGLVPNIVKVGPSIGVSFATFELSRDFVKAHRS